jgi:protein PhnA
MTYIEKLKERAGNCCELCGAQGAETAITVPPKDDDHIDHQVLVCDTCLHGYQQHDYSNTNHWRALTGSVWSVTPSVQALSYKILYALKSQDWASEALDAIVLEDSVINWALHEENAEANRVIHKDAYGNVLANGDHIVLTENLNVKGTSYTAPKGTQVKKIRLVADNAEQIEGKIGTDTIVILTKFVKKA